MALRAPELWIGVSSDAQQRNGWNDDDCPNVSVPHRLFHPSVLRLLRRKPSASAPCSTAYDEAPRSRDTEECMPRKPKCPSCLIAVAMVLALVTLRTRDVRAQPYCVPNAVGVPGNPGPPAWWTSPQPLDDPRWQGALGNSTGLGDQAEVRAVTYNDGTKDYIVLFFQVKADPGAAGAGDIVYVGVSDGTAAGVSNVIRLTRGGSSSTPAEGSTPPASDLVV